MDSKKWDINSIPTVEGKRVIITGGSSGIGFEAAKVLSGAGAEVIIAVRSINKGEKARQTILRDNPSGNVTVMYLDLADLSSVRKFAAEFKQRYNSLNILINNAGVMVPPYKKTAEGFELQFGTNHLGHFVLTAELLPLLNVIPGSRIVTLSSIASRGAKIKFDNLDGSKGYNAISFYGQSKLSNLLFGIDLNKRLRKSGSKTISIVCHPGISDTNLTSRGSGKESNKIFKFLFGLFAQPAEMGVLPTLYAATNSDLKGGEFIGPNGWKNIKGNPVITNEERSLFKEDLSNKLWDISEKLTKTKYNF